MSKKSDQVKAELLKKAPKETPLAARPMLSTGVTTLNLACTGKPTRGVPVGAYVLIVGDSAAGKTWISLQILAEAANDPRFDDYLLIHDDAEGGAQMDKERYFGKKAAKRIQAPKYNGTDPVYSEYVEEFYDRVDSFLDDGKQFIYVMDSQDVLTSRAEAKKVREQKAARGKGAEETGAMTDAKAKIHSTRLRRLIPKLRKSGSILLILSQTRDNMGFGAQFDPKTRSGGKALRFYADLEWWLSLKGKLKRTAKGKQRTVGNISQFRFKKNRITGRLPAVDVPIYYTAGIDEVGACIEYLIEEGHWKETKGRVDAEEFEFEGTKEKLIRHIEEEGLEKELQALVKEVWNEIEEASKVERKPRYA